MRFDIITIFPAMVEQALTAGIVGRAIGRGTLSVQVHDLRTFTTDRHRVVDDVPYGGGPGMVLKPEPIFRAIDAIAGDDQLPATVLLTSPSGDALQPRRSRGGWSRAERLVLVCGRYEGVDERVRARIDEEISIGDYVLSGGELPALVILDSVERLLPGVVGDQRSVAGDSFSRGLLDFPAVHTRPRELTISGVGAAALKVPDVLLSGNHADIRRWRKREAVTRTLARRPDLLSGAELDEEELEILRELVAERDRVVE